MRVITIINYYKIYFHYCTEGIFVVLNIVFKYNSFKYMFEKVAIQNRYYFKCNNYKKKTKKAH